MSGRKGIVIGGVVTMVLIVAALVGVSLNSKTSSKNPQILFDGSTLLLNRVVLATNGYSYSYNSRGRLGELLGPVLPGFILQRFPMSGGSFGFGIDQGTNLVIITVNRQTGAFRSSILGRLRVSGDGTNIYDACWGANTLGMQNETVQGWQVRAFPRRSKKLKLEFLARNPGEGWSQAADFEIQNPLWKDYPQWQAEAFPTTRTDGNLAVTLREFRSGERMEGTGGGGTDARKTVLRLTFAEEGKESDDWRIQKVTIADATGNEWSPYLDLVKQQFNWAKGGQAEFLGALWPGENAWKLKVEVVRSGAFSTNETFKVKIPLPAPGAVLHLTNEWIHDDVTLKLVGLASPNTDQLGDFKWIAKWWGNEKDKVYSLALRIEPDLNGQRFPLIGAIDEKGSAVELLEQRNQDYKQQALFLKPGAEAQTIELTFATTRSRFVEFVARPEFVAAQN